MGARTMTMQEANAIAQKRIAELEAEVERLRKIEAAAQDLIDQLELKCGPNPVWLAEQDNLAKALSGGE